MRKFGELSKKLNCLKTPSNVLHRVTNQSGQRDDSLTKDLKESRLRKSLLKNSKDINIVLAKVTLEDLN